MNPTDKERILDEKIDALCAKHPVTATREFTAATLNRVKRESAEQNWDETIDTLLAAQPIEAAPDFLQNTLSRIQRDDKSDGVDEESATIHRFPIPAWVNTMVAVAAVVVIGLVSFFVLNQTARTAPPAAQLVYHEPDATEDGAQRSDPIMDELFLLAEDLSEAELFLDEAAYDTIAVLAAQ